MAITNYSERDVIQFLVKHNPDLSPGMYEPSVSQQLLEKKIKAIKSPPFGKGSGMSNNSTNIHSYIPQHQYTPGPGQYEINLANSSFDSSLIVNVGDKEGVYFVVKNGTQKQKQQWLSADKTKKGFEVVLKNIDKTVPGPGAYSPRNAQTSFDQNQKSKSFIKHRNSHKITSSVFKSPSLINHGHSDIVKLTSVPSIRSNVDLIQVEKKYSQINNYPQDKSPNQSGTLNTYSRDVSPNITVQTSVMMAQVKAFEDQKNYQKLLGPGTYDPVFASKNTGAATTWSKSKIERKLPFELQKQIDAQKLNNKQNMNQTQIIEERPLIEDDKILYQQQYQNNLSMIVESNNDKKMYHNMRSPRRFGSRRPFSIGEFHKKFVDQVKHSEDSELEESDDDKQKQASPGPGHYYNAQKFSSIKKEFKEQRHQYFGSSEDRFKKSIFQGDDPVKGTPKQVGPGTYNLRKAFVDTSKHQSNTDEIRAHFQEIRRVFDINKEQFFKPGPGKYDTKDNAFSKKKDFYKQYQAAFGSSDGRKIAVFQETETPGPGQYNQEQTQAKYKQIQANFKSGTKRTIDPFLVPDPSIPSAQDYNLQHYKGTSYNQLQGGAPNNILILKRAVQKQAEKNFERSTFNQSKIGTNTSTIENYSNLGPGAYSPSQNDSFVDSAKKIPKQSNFNRSDRFQDKIMEKKQTKLPGPGHYEKLPYMEPSDWNKRTFNLRYLQNGQEVLRSKSQIQGQNL
ncbi:UNKNOWN [Stylonychia lemnae]|uniref:Uncharacterized protein n=1 Tax=Stylonychia lemnae TaxID=5949 RepID=A0A077ZUB9_STYLE|nr:UNKNOWN [Stylonychia lemnae]|eukprot:CDW73467.1 UNKNOWN [Stylonychia lemnae]